MLKVIPKGGQAWRAHRTACLGISMESRNHRDAVLAGLLNWAGKNFDHLIFDVSDTLHRYNFIAQGFSPEAAHDKALTLGDQWLNDHKNLIQALPVPTTIIRWDDQLAQQQFEAAHDQFRRAFDQQPLFHQAVLADAETFYKRKGFMVPSPDDVRLRCSVDYLLEEITVHSLLYAEKPCAILYPGKQYSSYRLVREGKVADVPHGLLNSTYTRMMVYNFGNLFMPHHLAA